jgi:hypothetical protein
MVGQNVQDAVEQPTGVAPGRPMCGSFGGYF